MDTKKDDYNISLFKPTTELARKNAKLTIILIFIWAIAVFGFQILLKIIEKPTPEPAYTAFQEVWQSVESGNASMAESQTFIKSALSVIGKLSVSADDKSILERAVTQTLLSIANDEELAIIKEKITAFNAMENISVSDPEYIKLKLGISEITAFVANVEPYSMEAKLLPFVVKDVENPDFDKSQIQPIMSKYLIHNQSFLTDAKFLGFPFHYFYTAVLLLILFVSLCWIFCFQTDRIYKKLGIEERI